MFAVSHVSVRQRIIQVFKLAAVANFILLSTSIRLLVFERKQFSCDSQSCSGCSSLRGTRTPSWKSSKFRILSWDGVTPLFRSSRRFFRHICSLLASSADKAGKIWIPISFILFLFSELLASLIWTSQSLLKLTMTFHGVGRSLSNLPRRWSRSIFTSTPISVITSLSFSFARSAFSFIFGEVFRKTTHTKTWLDVVMGLRCFEWASFVRYGFDLWFKLFIDDLRDYFFNTSFATLLNHTTDSLIYRLLNRSLKALKFTVQFFIGLNCVQMIFAIIFNAVVAEKSHLCA